MKLIFLNVVILSILVSSCGLVKKKHKVKVKPILAEFINPTSIYRCSEVDNVTKNIALLLTNKRKERNKILTSSKKKGANYFYETNKRFNNKITITTYKCDFKSVELNVNSDSIYLYSSDHIVVNCSQVKTLKDSYYHDDYRYMYNHYRNLGQKHKGNVVNLESTASGKFVLGIYKCSSKNLAQAKINIRKEYREKEANWLKGQENRLSAINNYNTTSALRDISYNINKLNYENY